MNIETIMGTPPATLTEATKRGIDLLNEHAPGIFEDTTEDMFVGSLHHGFGQHMRNYWGLWSQDSGVYKEINKQFKLEHADDISGIILRSIYRTKKGQPLELAELALSFHKHWEAMK